MDCDCRVISPCGLYEVAFSCDEVAKCLQLTVGNNPKRAVSNTSAVYGVSLNENDVETLTTAAGVVKEFRLFTSMLRNALLGRSRSLSFSVESYSSLTRRVHGATPEADDASTDSSPVFLLSYEVEFTKAVFPIPLKEKALEVNQPRQLPASSFAAQGGASEQQMFAPAAAPNKPQSVPTVVYNREAMLEVRLETSEKENAALKQKLAQLEAQNKALQRVSKEKLDEMRRECEVMESHMGTHAEIKRLKGQLAETTRRLRDEQHTSAGLRRDLDRIKRSSSSSMSRMSPRPRATPNDSFNSERYSESSARTPRGTPQRYNRFATPPERKTPPRGRTTTSMSTVAATARRRSTSRESVGSRGSHYSVSSYGGGSSRYPTKTYGGGKPSSSYQRIGTPPRSTSPAWGASGSSRWTPPRQASHHRPIFR